MANEVYSAKPTAAQIAAGYFILPRKLHREWKGRFPFHEYDATAFGKEYTRLRLDQNYRVRVRLKDDVALGDTLLVEVVSDRAIAITKRLLTPEETRRKESGAVSAVA